MESMWRVSLFLLLLKDIIMPWAIGICKVHIETVSRNLPIQKDHILHSCVIIGIVEGNEVDISIL